MNLNYQAGVYKNQKGYKSFSPSLVNKAYHWQDSQIDQLLEQAALALGKLDALSKWTPDLDQFLHMFITRESTSSNRIEGTKTEFDEALLPVKEIDKRRMDDYSEVHNYIQAVAEAVKSLEDIPISMRLLKQTHKTLLCHARGEHKLPGEIRKSQNWIGGSSLQDAFYVPPHHDELPTLLKDLEEFIHNDNLSMPDLIKASIIHYQFEAIHPFLDGNGRLGRLLIILFLIDKGLLSSPVLYISDFFDRNRNSYYDALALVKSQNNLDQWIKFCLVGIAEVSNSNTEILNKILQLKERYQPLIVKMGRRAKNASKLFEILFSHPIIEYKKASELLCLSQPSVNKLFDEFCKMGILQEESGMKKNRYYRFASYIDLFN